MHARLPVTVHIFLLRNNQVLLLRRTNTGYEDDNYSVVAGHLDGGESVTQAAIREAYEEVGIALRPADLTVVGVMHRVSNEERIDFFSRRDHVGRHAHESRAAQVFRTPVVCPRYPAGTYDSLCTGGVGELQPRRVVRRVRVA